MAALRSQIEMVKCPGSLDGHEWRDASTKGFYCIHCLRKIIFERDRNAMETALHEVVLHAETPDD